MTGKEKYKLAYRALRMFDGDAYGAATWLRAEIGAYQPYSAWAAWSLWDRSHDIPFRTDYRWVSANWSK